MLNRALLTTAGIHVFYILLRVALFRRSFTTRSLLLYTLLSTPASLIQVWFERSGRPQYEQSGEVQRPGENLEAAGLTEWMWDALYWTYGCIVLAAVVGDMAWWLWVRGRFRALICRGTEN